MTSHTFQFVSHTYDPVLEGLVPPHRSSGVVDHGIPTLAINEATSDK